jgi:twitching motility protein PilI
MDAVGSSPWELLLREAQNAGYQSKSLVQEPIETFWVGLSILTGDDIFLTPLSEIAHIVPVPKIAKIPHVKSWMLGVTMSRGEIFATTDLSAFLKEKETHITKHARILMMPLGDNYCGILVDKVLGLHRMHPSEIQATQYDKRHPSYEGYLMGVLVKKQIELPIISLKSIVEDPRFKNAVTLTFDARE